MLGPLLPLNSGQEAEAAPAATPGDGQGGNPWKMEGIEPTKLDHSWDPNWGTNQMVIQTGKSKNLSSQNEDLQITIYHDTWCFQQPEWSFDSTQKWRQIRP